MKEEIANDKQWRKDFRSDLDDLLKALQDEKAIREKEYDVVRSRLEEASKKVGDFEKSAAVTGVSVAHWNKVLWFVIGTAVSATIAIVIYLLQK